MVLPRVVVPALMIAALATGPITQAQVAAPAFEVASIRPNTSGSDERSGGAMPGGRFLATNVTLEILILEAYRIPSSRLRGGPGWLKSASFDLDARPAAAATEAQTYRMLRTLLEDRFSLRLRWETEDVNGYSLVTARGGSKLTSNTQADCAPPACGTQSVLARGQVIARGRSTDSLAGALEAVLGRPVRDETHLPGNYDFNLEFAPTAGQFGGNGREVADDVRPSIFTALEEQLGLKLEPATVPVEILVIDSAELPSSN